MVFPCVCRGSILPLPLTVPGPKQSLSIARGFWQGVPVPAGLFVFGNDTSLAVVLRYRRISLLQDPPGVPTKRQGTEVPAPKERLVQD